MTDSPVFQVIAYFVLVLLFSGVATWIGFQFGGDDRV